MSTLIENSRRAEGLANLLLNEPAAWVCCDDIAERFKVAALIEAAANRLSETYGHKPCEELEALHKSAMAAGRRYAHAENATAHEHAYTLALGYLLKVRSGVYWANIEMDDEQRLDAWGEDGKPRWNWLAGLSYPDDVTERIANSTLAELDSLDIPSGLSAAILDERHAWENAEQPRADGGYPPELEFELEYLEKHPGSSRPEAARAYFRAMDASRKQSLTQQHGTREDAQKFIETRMRNYMTKHCPGERERIKKRVKSQD